MDWRVDGPGTDRMDLPGGRAGGRARDGPGMDRRDGPGGRGYAYFFSKSKQ